MPDIVSSSSQRCSIVSSRSISPQLRPLYQSRSISPIISPPKAIARSPKYKLSPLMKYIDNEFESQNQIKKRKIKAKAKVRVKPTKLAINLKKMLNYKSQDHVRSDSVTAMKNVIIMRTKSKSSCLSNTLTEKSSDQPKVRTSPRSNQLVRQQPHVGQIETATSERVTRSNVFRISPLNVSSSQM